MYNSQRNDINRVARYMNQRVYDKLKGDKWAIEKDIKRNLENKHFTPNIAVTLAKQYYFVFGEVISSDKMTYAPYLYPEQYFKWGLLGRREQFLDIGINYGFSIQELIDNNKIPSSCIFLDFVCLDLSHLKIESLEGLENIKNIERVQWLFLGYNQIKKLLPGKFCCTAKLLDLYLNNNNIEEILPDTFKGLDNLKFLNLAYNNLTDVKLKVFLDLENLTLLNLRTLN